MKTEETQSCLQQPPSTTPFGELSDHLPRRPFFCAFELGQCIHVIIFKTLTQQYDVSFTNRQLQKC